MACLITRNKTKRVHLPLNCGINKMKYNGGHIWVVGLQVIFNLLLYSVLWVMFSTVSTYFSLKSILMTKERKYEIAF